MTALELDQLSFKPLLPEQLYHKCDPGSLGFETTAELPDINEFIGQPRAYRALEIGSTIRGRGYNIFVMGLPASGRTTLSKEYLERIAATLPVPDDLVYVNNFSDPYQPLALMLPAGQGSEFRKDIQALVTQGSQEIQRTFESEEFKGEQQKIITEFEQFKENAISGLHAFAAKYNFVIARTTQGFILVPAVNGQPLKPEEIEKLDPAHIEQLKKLEAMIGEEIQKTLAALRAKDQAAQDQLRQLDQRIVVFVSSHLINQLKAKYAGLDPVLAYLDALQADMAENVDQFRPAQEEEKIPPQVTGAYQAARAKRYQVNLLVDNSGLQGAPVIIETQPTFSNLVGRIEHQVVLGAAQTDFTMIRPGALHRANGGYLILPVRDVLLNAFAWEALKRALADGVIRITEPGSQLGLATTSTLEPGPVPLQVKVILIGTPLIYYLLSSGDEDFPKLFKVRAEFTSEMDRTPDTEREYALFLRSVTLENGLLPFDRSAVARIIEYGSRMVSDQSKLSTRFGQIADVAREADYWARKLNHSVVSAEAVDKALTEFIFRSNLVEDRTQQLIERNTLYIQVEGTAIGQINALSVLGAGDYSFGRPSRVTAVVTPGRAGVVDIESRAELGGPIHTKGVLILTGLISARFGREKPISISASLTFEQSYTGVDGDSASAAEYFALLSAISKIPLRQDLAITGSVNQQGQIQPIGGVNEKIEGFFTTCQKKGLTGTQGVIIPGANIPNLMLREPVITAVREKRFNIYAISTVEEGIELLTGQPAGKVDENGHYPPGSVNAVVMDELSKMAKALEPGPKTTGKKPTSHKSLKKRSPSG